MEYFFTNNLYIIFAFIIYSLYISEKPKEINKRIIVIYSFISLLAFFNVLDIKIMLCIFIFISFLYFEILMNDYYKFKIIKKLRYKVIDFIYI